MWTRYRLFNVRENKHITRHINCHSGICPLLLLATDLFTLTTNFSPPRRTGLDRYVEQSRSRRALLEHSGPALPHPTPPHIAYVHTTTASMWMLLEYTRETLSQKGLDVCSQGLERVGMFFYECRFFTSQSS